MASMTSDTGDTSSKQQQAQCKENYNKSRRPVSSVKETRKNALTTSIVNHIPLLHRRHHESQSPPVQRGSAKISTNSQLLCGRPRQVIAARTKPEPSVCVTMKKGCQTMCVCVCVCVCFQVYAEIRRRHFQAVVPYLSKLSRQWIASWIWCKLQLGVYDIVWFLLDAFAPNQAVCTIFSFFFFGGGGGGGHTVPTTGIVCQLKKKKWEEKSNCCSCCFSLLFCFCRVCFILRTLWITSSLVFSTPTYCEQVLANTTCLLGS